MARKKKIIPLAASGQTIDTGYTKPTYEELEKRYHDQCDRVDEMYKRNQLLSEENYKLKGAMSGLIDALQCLK
jgi:hypothetical protein